MNVAFEASVTISMKFLEEYPTKELPLGIIIIKPDGDFLPLAVGGLTENWEHRRKILYDIGKTLREKNVLLIGFIMFAESWMSMWTIKGDEKTEMVRPSEDPDRKECIVITAKDIFGKSRGYMKIISRNGNKVEFTDVSNSEVLKGMNKWCSVGDHELELRAGLLDELFLGYMAAGGIKFSS